MVECSVDESGKYQWKYDSVDFSQYNQTNRHWQSLDECYDYVTA